MMSRDYLMDRQFADDRFSQEEKRRLLGQPDVLCVDEYLHVYQCRPAETPERRLLAAILRDAIDCYLRHCCAKNRHRKRSFREAEEWFFGSSGDDVFSLESVCGILNIDPSYVRKSLLRRKDKELLQAA
jgi:hypothetical protein